MKDWIDSPAPGYRQRIIEVFWCRRCKESYDVSLRMENDVGDYSGDESCPLCGHDGIAWADRGEEAESIE